MALAANYPIAIAPGMGLNAYFAYSVVGTHDISYQTAFAAVFVAGVIFVILSLTPFRKVLIEAIPENLKHGITAGIGLFIAFIGMSLTGMIVAHPSNLVALGDLHSPNVLLALLRLRGYIILMTLTGTWSTFLGMIITGIVAYFTGNLSFDSGFVQLPSLPEGIIVSNPITAFADVTHHMLYAVVFLIFACDHF